MRLALILLLALLATPAAAELPQAWPEPDGRPGTPVTFPSSSPFSPAAIVDAEPTTAQATFFVADGASAASPRPAVVLLHGSGGVIEARERGYARQLAGSASAPWSSTPSPHAAIAGTSYLERILDITETVADGRRLCRARWLAGRRRLTRRRVRPCVGFSYGGWRGSMPPTRHRGEMAAGGERFAGHDGDPRRASPTSRGPRTTGAPVLMQMGGRDALDRRGALRRDRGGPARRRLAA